MSKNKDGKNVKQRDPDLANAEFAMQRAALKAREIARKTGTAIVTSDNKIIKEEYPGQTSSKDQ